MKQEVASFLNYVAASPTVFQATQQACDMLEAAGFTRLSEQAAWNIVPGGRYFVTRNRSAVVAFAVPETALPTARLSPATAILRPSSSRRMPRARRRARTSGWMWSPTAG